MTSIKTLAATWASVLFLSVVGQMASAQEPPTFSKVFSPDTISAGSASTLTFTIDNSASAQNVTDMDFTDTLPAGMTIAFGVRSTECEGAVLGAPIGGGTITFMDGSLGANQSCTVTVNVTSSTAGISTNTSGDLTSSAGNSGPATDDLIVTLPEFSKSLSPASADLNQTVTVTYLIDNSANAAPVDNLDFSETFPVGVTIASPANASTTCGTTTFPPILTAPAGGSTITLDADGFSSFPAVAAGATCTVSVDIVSGRVGPIPLISDDLLANFVSAGFSDATLEVSAEPLNITKDFLTNPVNAGASTTLRFTIDNFNRFAGVTDVTFTDELTFLPGLTFDSLLSNSCGGTVTGVGGTSIGLTGGFVAPDGGQCRIDVSLSVPAGAEGGTYTNETSRVTGLVDGEPIEGNSATRDLIVPSGGGAPVATLEFLESGTLVPNPTPNAGDPVVVRVTVTNGSATNTATDVATLIELTPTFPSNLDLSLPPTPDPPCGAGSTLSPVSIGGSSETLGLQLSGGSLAPGATCSFELTVTLPNDLPGGTYSLTPNPPTATVGGVTVSGTSSGDSVNVAAGLNLTLTKTFSDDTVVPGGTVTLNFDIALGAESVGAQDIGFTDDLDDLTPSLTGLTATGLPVTDACGGTLDVSESDTFLTLSGGTLASGSCSFAVTLNVPANAPVGTYTNTTSAVSATPEGGSTAQSFAAASADLDVIGMEFRKEFLDSTVVAGGTTTLRFEIENLSATEDATITFFTDNLDAALTDLAATGPAPPDTCGGSLSGTTFLIYTGGSVSAGDTCVIEVEVLVPAAAPDGDYTNTTSALSASLGGNSITVDPAVANLAVQSAVLEFSKTFIPSGPVAPGDSVDLEFEINNPTAQAIDTIAFSDNLATMLDGALFTGAVPDECGGMVTSGFPTTEFEYAGGSLAANESCTVRLTLSIPASAEDGEVTNTSSEVTGLAGTLAVSGDPAIAKLNISSLGATFSKSFDGPALPDDTAILTFEIGNPNASALPGLGFTDNLDDVIPGLVASALPPSPCGAGSSITGTDFLTFTGGAVDAGGTCSFDVTVTVPAGTAGGTYGNTTSDLTSGGLFSADPATADLTVTPTADIGVTKTDGVTSVVAGTTIAGGGGLTYTIVATNNGPNDDPAVSLTDTLPAALSCGYSSVAAGGASGNTSGTGNLAETLSMPVGSSVTYTVDCDVASDAAGTLTNTASVNTSLTDQVAANNSATDDNTVITSEADLSVTKTDSATTVVAGESVTYTIVAANAGPSDDPSVTLSDSFPGVQNCSYTSVAAGGATGNAAAGNGALSETLSLPAGSSVTYTAACGVSSGATGTLSNTVTLTPSVSDPDTGNNAATDETLITSEADLSVTKTDGLTSVVAGENLTYTIVVENAGPSDDPAVEVADIFPDGLSCSYSSGGMAYPTMMRRALDAPLEQMTPSINLPRPPVEGDLMETEFLPVGGSVTYSVDCLVDPGATGTLSNTVNVSSSVTDPDTGNNAATDDTEILIRGDLSVTKTDGVTSVVAGESLTYTIVAANAGPSNIPEVSLTDYFQETTPPALQNCEFSSEAADGATGNSESGSGVIIETLSLPAGSSVTYTATCDVRPEATGTVINSAQISGPQNSDTNGDNNRAIDDDTVITPEADLSVTKTDGVTTVEAGLPLTYEIVVSNAGPSVDPAVSIADPFPDALTGCTYRSVEAGGATGATNSGSGDINDSAVSMPVGSSVTYTAICVVDPAASGILENSAMVTASVTDPDLSNNVGTDANTAVSPVDLVFSKVFDPNAVALGQTTELTFTVNNAANAIAATSLAFSDDLSALDLTVTDTPFVSDCGGALIASSGTSTIALDGGSVAAGESCEITVTLRANTPGTQSNLTSELTSNLPTVAGATDELTVAEAEALTLTKALSSTEVAQGETVTMTLEIANPNPFLGATDVALQDDLAGTLVVASDAVGSAGCDGAVSGAVGDTAVSFAGDLAPDALCTITVDVTVTAEADFDNTATLTSSLGETSATVAVTVADAEALTLTKALSSTEVAQGETVTMTLEVANPNPFLGATDVALLDDLAGTLVVASDAVGSAGCDGAVSGAVGDTAVSFAGDLAPDALCTITVDVTVTAEADFDNTATLTSSLGETSATVAVTVAEAEALTLSKALSATEVAQGETVTMTLEIANPNPFLGATDVALQDDLAGTLVVASDAVGSAGCDGAVSGAVGDTAVSFAGDLAPDALCTITVDVTVTAEADFDNTATLTSSLGETSATVAVTVAPAEVPVFTKAFDTSAADQGETIGLTITVENPNAFLTVTEVRFDDAFPEGLALASAPVASAACGSPVLTGATGQTLITFRDGTLAPGALCSVTADVLVTGPVSVTNVTSNQGSVLGTSAASSPAASAALTVIPAPPLDVSLAFAPASIEQTQTSVLTITLANTSLLDAADVAVSDSLPTGLRLSATAGGTTTCSGGVVSAPDGGDRLSLTGATLDAGASCTVSATVTSALVGTYDDTTESQTSSLGDSLAATGSLEVTPATTGSVIIVQETDTDGDYGFSASEAALNFTISTVDGFGARGPITLPAGTYLVSQAAPAGVGNTSVTCSDSNSVGRPVKGEVSITLEPLETLTCTFTSIASLQKTVDAINRFLTKRADFILSSEPSPSRRFARLNRGLGGSRVVNFADGDLKSMLPFTLKTTGSDNFHLSTSLVQMQEAAANFMMAHDGVDASRRLDNHRFDIWMETQFKRFEADADSEGHFAIAYFGLDYLVTEDLLVGALIQIDDMEDASEQLSTTVRGTGWMVGPYVTARLTPNLYFDGRIAAGRSRNEISPFNTYTDDFSTTRWMAMASLTGEFQRGNWQIRPAASLSYFEETQDGYTDSLGVDIPSQTVKLGQIKLGPTFTGSFVTPEGMPYYPYFSFDAINNIGDTEGVTLTDPDSAATEGWRGRIKAGVDWTSENGTRVSLGGTYDGIGRDDFEAWGFTFDVTIPLHKGMAR